MPDKLDINPELKKAVVARLAGLDRDHLMAMLQMLQETVLGQAVQLYELQAENAKQVSELNVLKISLEESLAQLSRVKDTVISREKIAAFVKDQIQSGKIQLPSNVPKNGNMVGTIECESRDIDFHPKFGIFVTPIVSIVGVGSFSLKLLMPLIPDVTTDGYKKDWPGFTPYSWERPTLAKRVRKPKAKPASEKKADKS